MAKLGEILQLLYQMALIFCVYKPRAMKMLWITTFFFVRVATTSVRDPSLPRQYLFFFIWFVRLLALRPFLAYCASLG
jgi:hypothetical protein